MKPHDKRLPNVSLTSPPQATGHLLGGTAECVGKVAVAKIKRVEADEAC